MAMTCCVNDGVLLHYTGETKTYYVDLGEAIKGRTITSVTSVTSPDAALVISSVAVLAAAVDDYDQYGNAVTIEAYTGISFTMSGGTAGSEDDDETTSLRITFVTSAGTEQAKVRLKVVAI
jgi:hypothetical protein